MKMTRLIVCALGLGASALATAGEMRLKSEVVGAESKIGMKSKHMDPIRGYGAAFSLESEVADGLALGGRVGYLKYGDRKGGGDSLKFDDSSAGVFASYDLMKTDSLSLYALGGASYHVVDFKDQTDHGFRLSAADAYLWNYDAGVGGRLSLTDSVALGLEYRYSDTLQRPNTKVGLSNGSERLKGEFKDLSLQSQQVAVSVAWIF
jgi:opacity protein-like surface antigen